MLSTFTSLQAVLLVLLVYGLNTSTGIVVSEATLQDAISDRVRGGVFMLLDITRNGKRLASLAVGGLLVDVVGIRALYWGGGCLSCSRAGPYVVRASAIRPTSSPMGTARPRGAAPIMASAARRFCLRFMVSLCLHSLRATPGRSASPFLH